MTTRPKSKTPKITNIPTLVVVIFQEEVKLPYKKGAESLLDENGIGPWQDLKKDFPKIALHPMYTAISEEKLRTLIDRAMEMDSTYRPGNFFGTFYIPCPAGIDPDKLAASLSRWKTVKSAYVDRPAPDPIVNAADDPRSPDQGYLDPAPDGIDAEYAWGFVGGGGEGIAFIDMERGWTLDHEDLVAHGAALLHGTVRDESRSHGTSVLGEVCAVDNTIGCVGIAPNIASVNVVSFHDSTRPAAMTVAIDNLDFGDVLLLEAQTWGVDANGDDMLGPIELLDADYNTIRLATALGIVVIEAGGNGNHPAYTAGFDLDTYTDAGGLQVLNPASGNFRDSGAIIVAAASSAAPHTRRASSTFGARIDCYAWGQNINTLSSSDAGATTTYTTGFNGTSGASPIITGAAIIVQGIAEDSLGYRFSPRQLRDILRDPATGTAPDPAEPTAIGVMPDLRQITDNVLGVSPDVYIRDNVGDLGDPHSGSISGSPDIILRPDAIPDPQAAFGAGSGTESTSTLGYTAEAGQDNYIYARVQNRGGNPGLVDVQADVYWSPVATLVTPDLWTLVGSTVIPNVPTPNQLTVSPAIVWPAAEVPGNGHYCFVGLIGCDGDPMPGPADFLDWDNFTRFIRDNNNATWRNFNVEDNLPDPAPDPTTPKGWKALEFMAPGAPDKARKMHLEILPNLPAGARLVLEAPAHWLERLGEMRPYTKVKGKPPVGHIRVNPFKRHRLAEMEFPAKSRTKLRLLVYIPEEGRKRPCEVAVRQIWRDQEVGRVTWHLAPSCRQPVKPKPRKKRR
jgi:hypothetical protein